MVQSKKQLQLKKALEEFSARREMNPMPTQYPHVLAGFWDLAEGNHPSLMKDRAFFAINPFFDDESVPQKLAQADLPLIPCLDGHNLMVDHTFPTALGIDEKVPVSPLFARDLTGRIIHLGYGPETKTVDDWWEGGVTVLFPQFCHDVTDAVLGAELIENVFFTRFRTLDMAFGYDAVPSGRPDLGYAAYYEKSNLYPYKVRLDTFYQDGWRLPQTKMLFARSEGVNAKAAQAEGEAFLQRWRDRPAGQSYEDFYEANDGDNWYESLFVKGCTVIPTLEAANGYNQVSAEFEIEDFWPGRAVAGLHVVEETRADEAPAGTILEVLEPGFVLAKMIYPARVVVSDGSQYKSPHTADPQALLPDLRLPHQRTTSNWYGTWLPTHPSHFEAPAVWGWDSNGRFCQLEGPLWDPLHYYYESVPHVLRAFREPLADNQSVAMVPESIKTRFFPIKLMNGFDTITESSKQRRAEMHVLPVTGIDRVRDGKSYCDIGYHPLPMSYEFEFDSWWFPELSPQYRVGDLPEELANRLAPVISSKLMPENYLATVNGPQKATWLTDREILGISRGEFLEDYPHLKRHIGQAEDKEMLALTNIFLSHIDESIINLSPQDKLGDADLSNQLEDFAPGVFDAFYEFSEAAFEWRQLRHKLFRQHPGWYTVGLWKSILPYMIADFAEKQGSSNRQQGERGILRAAVSSTSAPI